MAYLLDTTAVSELTRRDPNRGLLSWLSANVAQETFIGSPSIGELELGIGLLDASKRRRDLEAWLEGIVADFEDRILPFDVRAARIWGKALASAKKAGRSLSATDAQIAAIACVHAIPVVTRNVRHFAVDAFRDIEVINPWR